MTINREVLIKSLIAKRKLTQEDWMTMDANEYNYYLRTLSDNELACEELEDDY